MAERSDRHSPGGPRNKLDATGEFFTVGQPLHAVRASYVRRPADDVLYDAITGSRYAHVVAPDRSGKSSLVAATAARLEANGFSVAVLDLGQIGVRDGGSDAGRWYYSVAYRLLRQLRIRFDLLSWWQDKSILSNRQRLVEFYSDILLGNIQEQIVVFVDGIQCIGELPYADQLLASVRAAHNARTTDPDFSRLTFVLLGECDPNALIEEPEASPFQITQPVTLGDFAREDLKLFGTELELPAGDAEAALDRIYHWTSGQPYLTQKLARAVVREGRTDDVVEQVDRIVAQQLAGRAAIHNEPHISHIHRKIVTYPRHAEALLNLYGKVRKGVEVAADLGSPLQRYLIAVGLLVITEDRTLAIRNRVYAAAFTTRWANENLRVHWRGPAIAAAVAIVMLAIPFWYTQLLPRGYVEALTAPAGEFGIAAEAYGNFRSFPGHAGTADRLYRSFLQTRASTVTDVDQIEQLADMAGELPEAGRLSEELLAGFWDRRTSEAMHAEQRDAALLGSLEALVLSTPIRRRRAAMLIGDDYPLLEHTLSLEPGGVAVFEAGNMVLSKANGAVVSQWTYDGQAAVRSEDWSVTALEVTPLVRRVIVDRQGTVSRIGLTVNISHARLADLRIKLIAPSGRTIEIETGVEQAAGSDDIRIPASQLRDLVGEPVNGTWSLSVRDEAVGVAGQLIGWNLKLNSQVVVEDFERGLNITDPVERETDNIWFSDDGRFVVARATQSDSARVWDLAFGKPLRAVAVGENEQLIGLDAGARHLVTATQDAVVVWDMATGDKTSVLKVGPASTGSRLTADGLHLFAQAPGDIDTQLEIWSIDEGVKSSSVTIAGTPALVETNANGSRAAVADYDRAVRIWDMATGELLAQISLNRQPSSIALNATGDVLGVVYGDEGMSLWRVDRPQQPLIEKLARGRWQLEFSPSGANLVAGTAERGHQMYRSSDGSHIGPALGSGHGAPSAILAFSADEQTLVTGGADTGLRFWRAQAAPVMAADGTRLDAPRVWSALGDRVMAVSPDAMTVAVGDGDGNLHMLPVDGGAAALAETAEQVSFLGHNDRIRVLRMNSNGSLVASAAADNTIRVWHTGAGDPRPFISDVPGSPITSLEFSPDSTLLAVLNGGRAQLLDTQSGDVVTAFELGENHEALAFASNSELYIGGESGALRVIQRADSGSWSMQQLWTGGAAVRRLEASPRGRFLVVVDANHRASQFHLIDSRPGELVIELPQAVNEVRFAPGGTRVLFRTTRWIHRAASSTEGLRLLDSVFTPSPSTGSRIVFGPEPDVLGGRFHIPVAGDGFPRLAPASFALDIGAGLFGARDELLAEWRRRLALVAD